MSFAFGVDPVRSQAMRRIRSSDTTPEIALRKALWSRGVRYRKHYARVPGKPDIAVVGRRVAIFVDGDFWHGYNWQDRKRSIKTNRDYWVPKIERTIARDRATDAALQQMGWTVLRFWDFEVRRDLQGCVQRVLAAVED